MSEQQHSIVDQPATVEACQADLHTAAQAAQAQADARNNVGALGTGQQHTHRS
ncbi:hypothetical protein ACIPW5_11325 [Streptomyces sp. NPDC090077]|uniref:hypothetical protein n=1 Tax=Streptomyces sp. NPDC090077 TaxID=3365938 RepID=UPI00381D17E7